MLERFPEQKIRLDSLLFLLEWLCQLNLVGYAPARGTIHVTVEQPQARIVGLELNDK